MAPNDESTAQYQRLSESRSAKAGPRSVTRSLKASSTSDSSEAYYWNEKFGFGPLQQKRKKYAHFRSLRIQAGTASVVHQILLSPTATSKHHASSRNTFMAVACGPRVPLYGTTPQSSFHRILLSNDSATRSTEQNSNVTADRMVPTTGQLAVSIALRVDGRLLAIGTNAGIVRIADTTSRVTLCQLPCSRGLSIRSVAWFRDGQHVLVAGDDGLLQVWHMQERKCVVRCKGHGDGIRCANLWQKKDVGSEVSSSSIAATGSSDHTVRLWDVSDLTTERPEGLCMSVLQHGEPVEALQWTKSSHAVVPIWLISAGGCHLKVWNPLSGSCVQVVKAFHRKTITSLATVPRKKIENDSATVHMRILTGGIDGLIRVYAWDTNTGELKFLHGVSLNEKENSAVSITAIAASYSGDKVAIGTSTGQVLVRQLGPQTQPRKRTAAPRAGTYSFFRRGMNVDPELGDHVVTIDPRKKRKLTGFDLAMRQFRYSDAVDEAIATKHPAALVSVMEELGRRHVLLSAISNRDEDSVGPVLDFVSKYISRPEYSAVLVHVANTLLDVYGDVAMSSTKSRNTVLKLKRQVQDELKTQKKLLRLTGRIDAIVTKAQSKL